MRHITTGFKSILLALTLLVGTSHALEPVSVTASSHNGNVPSNTLDNNLSTRWSAFGDGEWISYKLGKKKHRIRGIDIAFHRGHRRTASFQIQVSNDGNYWKTVWSGKQPISTKSLQSIPLRARGRYLRIFGFGNSKNDMNSISEVEIDAKHTGVCISHR